MGEYIVAAAAASQFGHQVRLAAMTALPRLFRWAVGLTQMPKWFVVLNEGQTD